MANGKTYDVAIIGYGPAGMTAALYAGRAMLSVCAIEPMMAGGQMGNTSIIENFPGFPEGIDGPDLSSRMEKQAATWNIDREYDEIQRIEKDDKLFRVVGAAKTVEAQTVIVASGSKPRLLGCPGEEELRGRGVSYCAVCDGAFFRDKKVVVVGGGDSAIEESLFLTKYVKELVVVHRRDELRATAHIQEQALKNDKITFEWSHVIDEIIGSDKVEKVRLRSTKTGETKELETDGVFIYVGNIPNTAFLKGMVNLDDLGYVDAGEDTITNCPGLFAAGDVRRKSLRQIVTALSDGAVAAMAAQHYLTS